VVVAVNTGTLAAPVWQNKTFYYWDKNADGLLNGNDTQTHFDLDQLFYRNANFTGGTVGADTTSSGYNTNTTDFRYGDLTTFNNIRLALPTGMVTVDTGQTIGVNGNRTANAAFNQRSDLSAIWDQYNTNSSGQATVPGTPTGWASNDYWSATSSGTNRHFVLSTLNSSVYTAEDTSAFYVALQVL